MSPLALKAVEIQGRILIIQQGYIRSIEYLNVAIGNTKFRDFALVTHDNYLDILEIKEAQYPNSKRGCGPRLSGAGGHIARVSASGPNWS
jgi:hypothetical protein